GSAAIVTSAGARALATGSAPVAMAQGFADGENMPLDLMLENLRRIIAATDLPVSCDIEGGYGVAPETVADTVQQVITAGAVGFNFEDQIIGTDTLYDIDTQCARIAAARVAADAVVPDVMINARTDLFLKSRPDDHTDAMLDAAITRAIAYHAAGADCFFAPALIDPTLIKRLCDACPMPVNILALPSAPDNATLASLGVARISYGPVPYKKMAAWLGDAAKAAIAYS
ncbi:MAG: isocitrate lyase/phosphoenolpyruvate mutase family protein, partial [Rhodobacterales bacterium]|nr:isocitrate lyase/phosphoenolpyruvate mutase family protein [Rhodobacterales bacterium]